jgi:hypothetical protein
MDITTLAAWGEFLGGIAVVVSLVYLASQIRQNSKLLRTSTASATSDITGRIPTLMVQDPEVARIFFEGTADRDALAATDRQRFDPLIALIMGGNLQEYQLAKDGVISPSVWDYRRGAIRRYMQAPGMQQRWSEWSIDIPQEIRAFVDDMIREGEAAG